MRPFASHFWVLTPTPRSAPPWADQASHEVTPGLSVAKFRLVISPLHILNFLLLLWFLYHYKLIDSATPYVGESRCLRVSIIECNGRLCVRIGDDLRELQGTSCRELNRCMFISINWACWDCCNIDSKPAISHKRRQCAKRTLHTEERKEDNWIAKTFTSQNLPNDWSPCTCAQKHSK